MRSRHFGLPALATIAFVSVGMTMAACYVGGEDAEAERRKAAAGASTTFVPTDPPSQPSLPPGAGPYSGPLPSDDKPPTPTDAGTPPADASPPTPPKDAAGDT